MGRVALEKAKLLTVIGNYMKSLKVTTLAEKLKQLKLDIAEIESGHLADLKDEEARTREEILKELKVTGLGNIKLDTGEVFTRAFKTTFTITDQALAMAWAQDKNVVVTKLDTAKVNKLLKREISVPDGFEQVDTEYLTVRSAASADEDEE